MLRRIFSKQNHALLSELVRTDFKLRYQGSVLGYAWSLLRPLLMFVILYVVFVKFLKVGNGVPNYPIYLLLGLVMWNFFMEMTMQSTTCIVGRGDLVRKIKIPRWMIVFATSLSALINLGLNLVVVAIFMAISHTKILPSTPFIIPSLLEIYVFALGISFFLAALFVRFRDVSYVWEVGMQAGFYITPVFYPLSKIPNVTLQKLIMLNPMAQAMQDVRFSAVTHESVTSFGLFHNDIYAYVPFAIVMLVVLIGVSFFRRESKYFAENI